jgi:multicomponent Na+:H+ antiporter subunit F
MTVEQAYQTLFGGALIILLVLIGAMCIRSIIGPRSTDRIMSVNMLGTMTICSIAILSLILDEGYLADVALIYAMISFVVVLILATAYLPARPGGQDRPRTGAGNAGENGGASRGRKEQRWNGSV